MLVIAGQDRGHIDPGGVAQKAEARIGKSDQLGTHPFAEGLRVSIGIGLEHHGQGRIADVGKAAVSACATLDLRPGLREHIGDFGFRRKQGTGCSHGLLHLLGPGTRRALHLHENLVRIARWLEALRQDRDDCCGNADQHHTAQGNHPGASDREHKCLQIKAIDRRGLLVVHALGLEQAGGHQGGQQPGDQ